MTATRQGRGLLATPSPADDGAAGFSRRTVVFGIAQAAAFGGLSARLYDLQVLNGFQQAALAEDNRTRTLWSPPLRGRILDATGTVLAESKESFRLVLYPTRGLGQADARRIAADVGPRLGIAVDVLEARVAAAALAPRSSPVVLAVELSFADVATLQVASLELANVIVEPQWRREYTRLEPEVALSMCHVVGSVGAVDRFSVDDEPFLRQPGARVGKGGVEAGMEPELRGVAGRATFEIDAHGRHVRQLDVRSAVPGRDVTLTIDAGLQRRVREALLTGAPGNASGGVSGAAVVLDIASGAVLALVSTPGFDAAQLRGNSARKAMRALDADPMRPLVNRATAGRYPPGSTFKIVTALAALEGKVLSPKERIECWGEVTYGGQTFRCWNRDGHASSDMHKAMRESCDCYFYEAARRTGIERIAAMARELGLGQTYDAGIEPQASGLVPTPAWKRTSSRTGWLLGETVLTGIGQGYVLTTPLQLAVMIARVASGRRVVPRVIAFPPGESRLDFEPLAVSETSLGVLRRALVAVVNEPGGTGHAADPGDGRIVVAGKTGTSQVSKASADRDRGATLKRSQRDHALFVAYAPAESPRYAVATVLEHAGSGGSVAGPVVAGIVKTLEAHAAGRGAGGGRAVPSGPGFRSWQGSGSGAG